MRSHELAKILLEKKDMDIALHANNNTYCSSDSADGRTHGKIKLGILKHYAGDHIIIGNMDKKDLNGSNWHITEMIHGELD